MIEQTENLILEHLRHMRAAIERLEHRQSEIKSELLTIREYQAAAHTDSINQAEVIDNLKRRVERIERRLELADND